MEWRNLGYDVYREIKGEELFKQKIEELEKPLPPPTCFDATKISLQTKKFKLFFGLKAFCKGQRATHPVGVGAQGIATIVSNPQYPPCELFTAGRSFPVCLRHSTIQSVDDVLIDFCGGSVRFAESDVGTSPFDLIMGTGPTTPLWNVEAIDHAVKAKVTGDLKTYLLLGPDYLAANIGGLRQKPDSFYDQRYYTEVILDFKGFDGVKRYARFRLIPADGSPETGLLSEEVQRQPWINERSPTETLPPDYLKQEYKERISKGPLEYKIQLQLHVAKDDDPPTTLHVGREWNESTHPWLDLADLTMTSLLSPSATEQLEFKFTNLPASLDLLPARSVHDPNVVAHIRSNLYACTQKLRAHRRIVLVPDHVATYVVRVETGSQSKTSNAPSLRVALTGTKGKTDLISLESHRMSPKEKYIDKYSVELMDIGEVLMIHLHKDCGKLDWFVNKIQVTSSNENATFEFPCYRWILSEETLIQRGGFTAFEDQPIVFRSQRILELQKSQDQYKWGSLPEFEDLPGFVDSSKHDNKPHELRALEDVKDQFNKMKIQTAKGFGLSSLLTSKQSWDSFDDLRKISVRLPNAVPKIGERDRWMNDAVFGLQFLNGCNPNTIRRCEVLPINFPVTEALVKGHLDGGKTLNDEMKEGHVYIVDYKELEDITDTTVEAEFSHTAQPLGLFYVKCSGDLVPIAIQLFQQPSDTNPIWTPDDSQYDWLLAKMWLRHADYLVQQVNTHLLKIQMEAFAVATRRQLPSIHPIFHLLYPHLCSVMAANEITKEKLSNQKGLLKLLKKTYKTFKFGMMSVPQTLEGRGVNDAEKLPNFYYRDDALRLWNAITSFIQKVISVHYNSDDDVAKDTELEAWVQDIHESGFPVREGDIDHEFPKSIRTRDQLVHVLTCIVFTCSCQYAAVTFGLIEIAGFVPNSPSLMRRPPPTKKQEATLKSIMETLPNKSQTARHLTEIIVLTKFADGQRFLQDYSETLLVRDEVKDAISHFQTALQNIADSIKARNASLPFPYINLLPERIPTGITI